TLESRRNGEELVVAGIIVQLRPMRSRRGARWAIVTLQDGTGVCEALVFPESFQKLEGILKAATPLLIKGRVAVEDVGTRVIVSDVRVLDQVIDRPPSGLKVRVQDGGTEATLEASSAVRADKDLLERVREICGADSVAVVE